MSYVRSDDEHEEGRLTQFRQRLSGEVRMQAGQEFLIFQDRNDIKWGQAWEERIEHSLDGVTFFIPIITPSFFNSPACRNELQRFIEREKKLKRNDLILPLYYVDCPLLNDEAKRASHEAAQAIAAHQYADWRDLRFEPFTTPQVGKTIAKLAVQIRDALDRVATTTGKTMRSVGAAQRRTRRVIPGAKAARRSGRKSKPATREDTEIQPQTEGLEEPSSRSEPPTLVVDPMHRGDHATISECIEAANPGGRLLVRPGLYQEGLVIEKPLEIIGDGDLDEIIIQAVGTNAVLFKTTMGRLANLTLRQMGSETFHCVNIVQGRLELEGCDVASQSLSCVSIHHGADPRLRRNRIHDSSQCGVIIYENGQGTLEDNDIFANTYSGVEITKGASPTLRHNRIHDNEQAGVHVSYSGKGTLEDNDIFGNGKSGMAIKEGGYPTVRRNRITRNTYVGVWVYEQGGGIFEDNDLRDNAAGPWDISSDSEAKVKASGNLE